MISADPSSAVGGASHRRIAAFVCTAYGVALAGFAIFYAYEIAVGAATQLGPAIMSGLLIALFSVGLFAVSRAWQSAQTWQRTPTLVWCALMLPVAYTLLTAGQPLIGLAVAASALLGGWAALSASMEDPRP